MATFVTGKYLGLTVVVSNTAARLVDLIIDQLDIEPQGSWRETILQVDPESTDQSQIRVGDASLGTSVGGVVQKGATLDGGSSMTNSAHLNLVPLGSIFVQSVEDLAPQLNVQLIPL